MILSQFWTLAIKILTTFNLIIFIFYHQHRQLALDLVHASVLSTAERSAPLSSTPTVMRWSIKKRLIMISKMTTTFTWSRISMMWVDEMQSIKRNFSNYLFPFQDKSADIVDNLLWQLWILLLRLAHREGWNSQAFLARMLGTRQKLQSIGLSRLRGETLGYLLLL